MHDDMFTQTMNELEYVITLENVSSGNVKNITKPQTQVTLRLDELNDVHLNFAFMPFLHDLNPHQLRFVIHDEFYHPRLMQPFPSYFPSRGCYFRVGQLTRLMMTNQLQFSLLSLRDGSLHPLLELQAMTPEEDLQELESRRSISPTRDISFHHVINIYNHAREIVQMSVLMALPRTDHPIHSKRVFFALRNPNIETDALGNQYLRHDNLLIKPGHDIRLSYQWRCTAEERPVSMMTPTHVTEWQSTNPEDEIWLLDEPGIETSHPEVEKISDTIFRRTTLIWNAFRLLFLEIHDRLTVEIISEEKGCAWALNNRKGDCTEFAAVFTAVLRKMNIPTRLVSGLKYQERANGWNRHAWTEVKAPTGEWIPIDPLEQTIGFNVRYIPIYVGNWIKEQEEVEFILEIHAPRHVDVNTIRQQLRITSWIKGSIKKATPKESRRQSSKVLFLEE